MLFASTGQVVDECLDGSEHPELSAASQAEPRPAEARAATTGGHRLTYPRPGGVDAVTPSVPAPA